MEEVCGIGAWRRGEGGEERGVGGEDGGAPEETFACAVVVGVRVRGVGQVGSEDLYGWAGAGVS